MATILSVTGAAPSPAGAAAAKAQPKGYILIYALTECDTAGSLDAQIDLPEGECRKATGINSPEFFSFEGKLDPVVLVSSAQMLK